MQRYRRLIVGKIRGQSIVLTLRPPKFESLRCGPLPVCGSLINCYLVVGRVFTIKEATMLKKVVLTVGLIAVPSVAPAQQQPQQQPQQQSQQQPQQQCQLECTWVTQKRETRVRSCYALNASDCANLGRAESGGNKTCQGYITSNCVQGR